MDNSPNLNFYEDVDSWETLMFLYNAALKEINTKIEILNDEFQHVHHYTPIETYKIQDQDPGKYRKKAEEKRLRSQCQKHGKACSGYWPASALSALLLLIST